MADVAAAAGVSAARLRPLPDPAPDTRLRNSRERGRSRARRVNASTEQPTWVDFIAAYGPWRTLPVLLALRRALWRGDPRLLGPVDKTLADLVQRARQQVLVGTCPRKFSAKSPTPPCSPSRTTTFRREFSAAGSNNEPAHPGSSRSAAPALVDTQP